MGRAALGCCFSFSCRRRELERDDDRVRSWVCRRFGDGEKRWSDSVGETHLMLEVSVSGLASLPPMRISSSRTRVGMELLDGSWGDAGRDGARCAGLRRAEAAISISAASRAALAAATSSSGVKTGAVGLAG